MTESQASKRQDVDATAKSAEKESRQTHPLSRRTTRAIPSSGSAESKPSTMRSSTTAPNPRVTICRIGFSLPVFDIDRTNSSLLSADTFLVSVARPEDSDSDSDVEILDAAPFVENEVLVLSDDDDDDDDDDYDFRARADEVVLSSDEEEDDSDDQVVIVSDNLAQGKTAGTAAAATPARFRKARDPAADLKWFMPYATAPNNQDVRLSVSSPRWNQQRNCSHPFSSSNSRTLGRTNLACTGIR